MVSRGITVYETPGEVHYWLQADQRYKPFYRMPLVAAAFTVFSIAAVPFVTMGRALAREMQGILVSPPTVRPDRGASWARSCSRSSRTSARRRGSSSR